MNGRGLGNFVHLDPQAALNMGHSFYFAAISKLFGEFEGPGAFLWTSIWKGFHWRQYDRELIVLEELGFRNQGSNMGHPLERTLGSIGKPNKADHLGMRTKSGNAVFFPNLEDPQRLRPFQCTY